MRGASRLVCLAGLLTGCLPAEPPYWWIDHPMNWGVRVSVTQPGGYASGIEVPEGQVRAAALPLDTVELEWLALAPDGVELAPPVWIACQRCAYGQFPGPDLPACPRPLPVFLAESCRLGEGVRLPLTFAGASTGSFGALDLLVVGSADPDLSPETCLQRLLTPPRTGLERCLVMDRQYLIGSFAVGSGLPEPTGPFDPPEPEPNGPAIPPEVLEQAPDTHPIVDGFWVARRSTDGRSEVAVPVGGEVEVRAGDAIEVEIRVAPESFQEYAFLTVASDGGIGWISRMESVSARAAVTALVDDFHEEDWGRRRFVVPADTGPFTMYFYVSDSREGRTAASLRFVPEDMSESP